MPDVALLITTGTVLFLLLGMFIAFMTLAYQKRRMQHEEEVLGLKAAYQKEILKAQLEMQEQTFLSISQEIHDNVGQILSLVRLHVSVLGDTASGATAQKLQTSKELLDQAIQDLRDLSKRLNSKYASQQSLAAMLEFHLNLISRTGAVETYFEVQGKERDPNPEKKLIIFRIAQEALNNSLKHAEANTIRVTLRFTSDKLALSISDDGKGFPSPDQLAMNRMAKGTGTYNMLYRAGLIGATLRLNGHGGSGTLVRLEIPLN